MKVSVEEEEIILRLTKMNGETKKSAHIKRLYFESRVSGIHQVPWGMGRKIDGMTDSSREVGNLRGRLLDMHRAPVAGKRTTYIPGRAGAPALFGGGDVIV
jgi:hypothetical protein